MAKQLSDLEQLYSNELSDNDFFLVRDVSSITDKKITVGAVKKAVSFPPIGQILKFDTETDLSLVYPDTSWVLDSSEVLDTGWISATLQSGWSNYGSEYDTAAFRRVGSSVYLRGMVKSGSVVNNTGTSPIFTLPDGFKPDISGRSIFSCTSAATTRARTDIFSSGVVQAVEGTNSWFSVAGIVLPCSDGSDSVLIERVYRYRRTA